MHFKLIIALTDGSITDKIVEAAREHGATGSTVISSAKGEGINVAKTFLGLSLETQRDVVLLLSKSTCVERYSKLFRKPVNLRLTPVQELPLASMWKMRSVWRTRSKSYLKL